MTIPSTFDVAGSVVDDVHAPAAQQLLSRAKAARLRPLCLCQPPGVQMYIAAAGHDLIVKRMPGTAAAHDHRCRSWLPPGELSGYGAVAERSIVDNPADGTTALRLGFSLSKAGNRAAPEPSDSSSHSVEADGNKLSLRAVLHYLWDEAELTTWHAGFAGHRPWGSSTSVCAQPWTANLSARTPVHVFICARTVFGRPQNRNRAAPD